VKTRDERCHRRRSSEIEEVVVVGAGAPKTPEFSLKIEFG
jgi:hypothetical protein